MSDYKNYYSVNPTPKENHLFIEDIHDYYSFTNEPYDALYFAEGVYFSEYGKPFYDEEQEEEEQEPKQKQNI